MRVLWLCNIMLPMVAEQLQREASNKEGWIAGLASVVLERQRENGIELAAAFPVPDDLARSAAQAQGSWAEGEDRSAAQAQGSHAEGEARSAAQAQESHAEGEGRKGWPRQPVRLGGESRVCRGMIAAGQGRLVWYGFQEDTRNPHIYAEDLEQQMREITEDFRPDVVHCFGTEYPHTLAMCRAFPAKDRLLVGVQGICGACAEAYFADLPEKVVRSVTLRDFLKRDSIVQQREKFVLRGKREREILGLAGNVTGRTAWDRRYTGEWNSNARYFKMNETLRPEFYEGEWQQEQCEPHLIFLSQGDYPIKGLHYMLLALPKICEAFPDTRVCVAGINVTNYNGVRDKLKIGAYGRYLRKLIRQNGLEERVCFLGKLDAVQMKAQYLKSGLFVCCSSVENSPNSLGEAMLLGVPCVSTDVGGIRSIFTGGQDGILYEDKKQLLQNVENLAGAVIAMWSAPDAINFYKQNARKHAELTHDREANYRRMTEIYAKISEGDDGPGGASEEPLQFLFVSNYINHHQIPFCNAMYQRLEGSFAFIQTEPMEEERVRMGWQSEVELPYVRYYYREPEKCRSLIGDAGVVLFGGTEEESYIEGRLRSGRPVIRYNERLYKEGQWKAVSPRGLVKKYHDHTRYRDRDIYLLCAGAYVASDFHIVRAYPGKMLRWGYFPETRHYDVDRLMADKQPATILWAARFLDWKHPELALECAKYLKDKGLRFHMDIVGDGDQRPLVDRLMEEYGLSEWVTLRGYAGPDEVRSLMEKADIYLATSDRKEGWGAVINEAMNSGCAVVADHMMGAAPFLIRHGENGFLFRDGNRKMLFELTERLLLDRELCRTIGRSAIRTIETEWNAENAAERLVRFCVHRGYLEQSGDIEPFRWPEEGPCSPAEILSERVNLWNNH